MKRVRWLHLWKVRRDRSLGIRRTLRGAAVRLDEAAGIRQIRTRVRRLCAGSTHVMRRVHVYFDQSTLYTSRQAPSTYFNTALCFQRAPASLITTTTSTMDDLIFAMPEALQDRLDAVSLPPTSQVTLHSHSLRRQLVSARSSVAQRTQALADLDQLVARIFTAPKSTEILQIFCSLQDTFECNGEPIFA